MGVSFQNPVRYSLDTAGRSSPSFVSLVLSVIKHSTSVLLRGCVAGCLAGSELVKHSGKTSLGEICVVFSLLLKSF